MPNKRYARVHYRKLVRSTDRLFSERTLSESIRDALHRTHANGRRYVNDWTTRVNSSLTNDAQKRLADNIYIDDVSVFGVLYAFTRGDMQALIGATESPGPSVPLASVDISESPASENNEYIKGSAYWLVVGDHVYVVQHVALRTKAFEEYLTWLLRETNIVDGNESIVLQSAFDISQIGGDLGNVKSIEIGGLALETIPEEAQREIASISTPQKTKIRHSLSEIRAPWQKGKDVLETAFGSLAASKIINSVPNNAALDVLLKIGYRVAGHRSIDTTFMQRVATSARNLDDGEVKIHSKDGTIQRNEARLHEDMQFNLVRKNSALLDLADARNQLLTVHQRFLDDGKIE